MDKYFICLANSYKRGGRCIAGVEIILDSSNDWTVIHNENGTPHWIRPIAHTTFGEIPNFTATKIQYFSIVKLTNVTLCPKEIHTEDVFYSSIEVCGHIEPTTENLNKFVDNVHTIIFLNHGKAVAVGSSIPDAYSLMIIHPESIYTYVDNSWEKPKTRMKITHCGTTYDFPVTDPIFLDAYKANPGLLQNDNNVYLTLSLGLDFEGWHHKLVATVFSNIPDAPQCTTSASSNKWRVKEERPFTAEEINAVQKAVVVANQYGKSICFYMKAGGQSYIPLTHNSEIGVGESVNVINLRLLTLTREGDNDIMRVKYDGNTAKEQSYMDRQKQLHANAYEKWTDEDDRLLLQMYRAGASINELMAKFGRNEGAIRSRIMKMEATSPTTTKPGVATPTVNGIPDSSKSFFDKIKDLFRKG